MNTTRVQPIFIAVLLFAAVPIWSQADPAEGEPAAIGVDHPEDRMLTPPPVTGATFPTAFAADERSNLLEYGVAFTTAYSDNVLAGTTTHPVSDISYSVAPNISIDTTTPRLHWVGTYAPGFTFYQRTSNLNESDQDASFDFQYRLTPHLNLSVRDAFIKSSNVFNQPDFGAAGAISGGAQVPNFSVIPPVADRMTNLGSVDLTYQFALNGMIGASGTFMNLHYPKPSQVPGLFDSSSQGGSAFYSLRISKMHYLGVTYQYQRLLSYPTAGLSETQTHAILFFYTIYPTSHSSISFFGGPQYSTTMEPPVPPLNLPIPETRAWTPAVGGSLSWQGRLTTLAVSGSHLISSGGGLGAAVHLDSVTPSIRRQLFKTLSGSISGGYSENNVIGTFLGGGYNGHSIFGTAEVDQLVGPRLSIRLGYTRLHQSYAGVPAIAMNPDTNREFIAVSYHFSRPLGK
jgi:hypothetical protein